MRAQFRQTLRTLKWTNTKTGAGFYLEAYEGGWFPLPRFLSTVWPETGVKRPRWVEGSGDVDRGSILLTQYRDRVRVEAFTDELGTPSFEAWVRIPAVEIERRGFRDRWTADPVYPDDALDLDELGN